MDYENRDDFNNILLQGMSVFGLITVVSGFLLWGATSSLVKKYKRKVSFLERSKQSNKGQFF